MSDSPSRALMLQALRDLDVRLRAEPEALDLRFDRAAILEGIGETELARFEYLGILAKAPHDARALNALGRILYASGSRTAARMAFADAVTHHPDDPTGYLNLAYAFVFDGKLEDGRRHYETVLQLDPDHPLAHQGLAYVLSELGDEEAAQHHRERGFLQAVTVGTYRGEGPPVRVLLLCSAIGGNVATAQFLDERRFLTTKLIVEHFDPASPLPLHDVTFNAIGDADRCATALEAARILTASTSAPVLNDPQAVLATGRLANAARFRALEGVVTPKIAAFPRRVLESTYAAQRLQAEGFSFPFLLRAAGFHGGRFFSMVETEADLAHVLTELPGDELLAIEYLDARGPDGKSRKYRAIVVDGKLFPLHLAISGDWKIHYGSARMDLHPEYQAEEARFLADMPGELGETAFAALERIRDALALDYGGIDFGVDAQRRILLFEANATMTVMPPEPHEQWAAYRREPAERILEAARTMLLRPRR